MHDNRDERRGSTVRWFALMAGILCVASLASAHALDWLTQSGRIALVADRSPTQTRRIAFDPGVDTMPTGSIAPSKSLIIRLR